VLFKLGQDWLASITPQYWQFWLGLVLVVIVLVGRERLSRWMVAVRDAVPVFAVSRSGRSRTPSETPLATR